MKNMRRMRFAGVVAFAALASMAALGCRSMRKAEGYMAGDAKVSNEQVVGDAGAAPPRAIYVGNFTVGTGAMKPEGGLFGEAEQMLEEAPKVGGGILGGGEGPIRRRAKADQPTSDQVIQTLTSSMIQTFNQEKLGIPAERLPPGAPVPPEGWLVTGQIVSVDPGNRAQRAVIGFGAGEATAEIDVDVDKLSPSGPTAFLRFGTQSDSGHAPGAVVTMNPYVAAAKFVIGRNATNRDVEKMGAEIAKQIIKYARERGAGSAPPAAQ